MQSFKTKELAESWAKGDEKKQKEHKKQVSDKKTIIMNNSREVFKLEKSLKGKTKAQQSRTVQDFLDKTDTQSRGYDDMIERLEELTGRLRLQVF